jgi:3-phosphoshikimate 1-carboxyvinyltransferase
MTRKIRSVKLKGEIQIPSSKSDGQRALLLASLAKGSSIINNLGASEDELTMLQCIKDLGATVKREGSTLIVTGGLKSDSIELHVGESGLASRLLVPICTAIFESVVITGEGSLLNRNMAFFELTLPQMGVQVELNEGKLPIHLKGHLQAGTYEVDGSESSQYISGLLIALSLLSADSQLVVRNLKSQPYLKMTLNTMKQFGIVPSYTELSEFEIKGNQDFQSCEYTVEGDWSSASYWLVASALGQDVKVSGLDMSSAQADRMILQAFLSAGCRVMREGSSLSIDGSNRIPINFDSTNCPDLFPALAVYGAMTPGISKIRGVHRLANKESDRAKAIISEFGKLGVKVEIEEDTLLIHGGSTLTGGQVDAQHDHRIAMSLAILGTFSQFEVQIEGGDAVRKSYPGFWDDLEKLSVNQDKNA